jgi:DNA gyrase subunit A
METDKVLAEYAQLLSTIEDLLDILAREERVLEIIKAELREIRAKYAGERLTAIVPDEGEINIEDLITNEGCIITVTHRGFIKRTAVSAYRAQKRGGKGVIGMQTREAAKESEDDDFVEHLFTASTHDYLVFFTKKGRCYVEKAYEIPEMGRSAKGRSIANLLEFKPGEEIAAVLRVANKSGAGKDETWDENLHILFATQTGVIKKTNLSAYRNIRKGGIIAINIEEGDQLIEVLMTNGQNEIVLITKDGMSIRFSEEDIRDMGRTATGVWGIRPDKGDRVIGAALVVSDATLLVAGSHGVGKRTEFDEYRLQGRGGKGIITMKVTDKTGEVVSALSVRETDEIMLITSGGQSVRTRVSEIRMTGRNAQGVRLIGLAEGEKLQATARVVSEEQQDEVEIAEE